MKKAIRCSTQTSHKHKSICKCFLSGVNCIVPKCNENSHNISVVKSPAAVELNCAAPHSLSSAH